MPQKGPFQYLLILVLGTLLLSSPLSAQTYNGTPGPIHDLTTLDLPCTVTGLNPATIDTANFGLVAVCLNITHTWNADIELSLVAPDGTVAWLFGGVGGGDDNFTGTCLTDTAALPINAGSAPFSGDWRPLGQMGLVNNGQVGNGTWYLRVADTYGADTGFVHSWSLIFGNNPATYYSVDATDLPLIVINTNGQSIPNDPKIMARMGIVDNGPGNLNHATDPWNNYDGWIGIEVRGNSSQGYPQKQYSLETRDSIGDNRETSLLGMPIENDWILHAPYSDKAFIRNHLAYTLSREMGQYATRTRYAELMLNGGYQGVYLLMESIKRDSNRVDIAKLTSNDLSGDDLTGGYLVKIDWVNGPYWVSNFLPDPIAPWNNEILFQMVYPDPTTAPQAQINYIQAYVDSFETALFGPTYTDTASGWRQFALESTFIDYFLLNELAKNVDAYRLSTYFYKHKDSDGGKLRMGPVWDFNGGWRGADYCNAPDPTGWQIDINNYCACDMPMWWKRLTSDTLFNNNTLCRWNELRTTLFDTAHIFHHMDSVATLVQNAQDRHFRQWPILGQYVWPNPTTLANTYAEEVANTKAWITQRIAWLDANLPGTCWPPVVAAGEAWRPEIKLYPNPSAGLVTVRCETGVEEVVVYDLLGREHLRQSGEGTIVRIAIQEPGVYVVTVRSLGEVRTQRLSVVR